MSREIQVLKETELLGQQFKVYGTFAEPLFLAKDVATMIGHTDASKMAQMVDDDEKVTNLVRTLGGNQKMLFLTESGLYEVLMLSRKDNAKLFKKGVKAILHEIRTTGSYSVESKRIPTKDEVEAKMFAIDHVADKMNLNDASKALMYNGVLEEVGVKQLDYVPSKGVLKPISVLLKEHNVPMSAQAFNKKLAERGILRLCTRKKKDGSDKHFYNISDEYLTYGENQVNPNNQSETMPKWYDNQFTNLLNITK